MDSSLQMREKVTKNRVPCFWATWLRPDQNRSTAIPTGFATGLRKILPKNSQTLDRLFSFLRTPNWANEQSKFISRKSSFQWWWSCKLIQYVDCGERYDPISTCCSDSARRILLLLASLHPFPFGFHHLYSCPNDMVTSNTMQELVR